MKAITEGIQSIDVWWLALFAVVSLLVSVVISVVVILMLPVDYFRHPTIPGVLKIQLPAPFGVVVMVVINLLGFCCALIGLVLLFLPGQGLLMILVGLLLVNFPGKYRLERWLIMRPGILPVVNRLRVYWGRGALCI